MSLPTPPGTPDPNSPMVVIPALIRGQFLALIGTIAAGFCTTIILLINIIYGGVKDDIKDLKHGVDSLNESFRNAYKASIDAGELVAKYPNLLHDVADTREKVINLPQQIHTLQQSVDKLQIQTNNIQKQIHTIPGIEP